MGLETQIAVGQWAPSYKRTTWMQAPLALVSFLAGVVAWLIGAGIGWLVAAVLIGAVVPFTFVTIMPTNDRLLATDRDLGSAETRTLLERWGILHMCGRRWVLWPASSISYYSYLHNMDDHS